MSTTTENVVYKFDVVTDSAVKELNALSKSFSSLETGFKQFGSLTNSFSKSIKRATSTFSGFKKVTKAFSGLAIGKALGEATKEAIDFYETLNLFQVAMKDSIETGKEFIDNISEWYGLDPATLMKYTGTFYEMAYAVGAPDEAARKLSTSLTALSVDLASLFNVDVDRVTDNLTSGIRGMSRAVVKYGLDLRATTVEAFANSKGITAQYETMNEASREILRYVVAITQARDATGDFARTIEQPANQLRVFKEQITQLGRAIGAFLVQPLQTALPTVNGFVMALRTMIDTVASLFGVSLDFEYATGLESANETVDELGTTADTTKKKLRALLAPFDELNVLQENSGETSTDLGYGTVDPEILKLLDTMEYQLEEVRMKAHDVRDAILGFFGFTPDAGTGWLYSPQLFEENLKRYLPEWTKTIESLFNFNYGALLGNFRLLFYELGTIVADTISSAITAVGKLFGIEVNDDNLSSWLDKLNEKFIDFRKWLHANRDEIIQFASITILLVAALRTLANILDPVTGMLMGFGMIAFGISAGFNLLSGALTVLTTVVNGLFSGFGLLMSLANGLSAAINGLAYSLTAGSFSTALAAPTQALALFSGGLKTSVYGVQSLMYAATALTDIIVVFGAYMAALFVGGFVKWAATSEEFRAHLARLGESFSTIFTAIKDIVVQFFSVFMLGVNYIAENFSGVFGGITGTITSLFEVLAGITKFIAGVFTNDWKRAWDGVSDIFYGFANVINSIATGAFNLILAGVNLFIEHLLNGFLNGLSALINAVGHVIGMDWDVSIPNIPKIPPIPVEPLPRFASGGVVTGPTRALIGEAGRSEAVIPLDNSPQMLDLIDKIAERVNGGETVVKVYIGDREWDAFTYESAQRGKSLVGAKPIKEGRA